MPEPAERPIPNQSASTKANSPSASTRAQAIQPQKNQSLWGITSIRAYTSKPAALEQNLKPRSCQRTYCPVTNQAAT